LHIYRYETVEFTKEFYQKGRKEVTYTWDIWNEAKKHFTSVVEADELGLELKAHIVADYYLLSSIFDKNKTRYTGIHKLQ